VAETIKLPKSEGVRENDFYWQFQLTLRNNWNNEENKTNSGGKRWEKWIYAGLENGCHCDVDGVLFV